MTDPFSSFVIFAEMRTGSNRLEANLNAIRGVTCFGEADPLALLAWLTDRPGHLPGFRYFHDHDPRVLESILRDRRCATIILTRNPLDSHVPTRLARDTNQWKLNETETSLATRIIFDGAELRRMLAATNGFRTHLVCRLQASGQAAFRLDYNDLRDAGVLH